MHARISINGQERYYSSAPLVASSTSTYTYVRTLFYRVNHKHDLDLALSTQHLSILVYSSSYSSTPLFSIPATHGELVLLYILYAALLCFSKNVIYQKVHNTFCFQTMHIYGLESRVVLDSAYTF